MLTTYGKSNPEWLENVVLVKKANGKWRMSIDFTDVDKDCPKDSYPLPSINYFMDNTSGCLLLSFLDSFSWYNQIRMHMRDESDTYQQISKDPTSTSQIGQSSRYAKSGLTKPRESISRRRTRYDLKYQKFFLLVFHKKHACK